MVTGLCRALLRDPTEAEDAAQGVFLSAHRSLLNGAEPREPAAWLATIARNECWARISGRMREPLPSDAADDVAARDDPVAEAIRRADLVALWRAIRALPRQQREALLLREFGGLRYDELAAALAVTEPAVESLLFRARTRLRAQLQSAAAALAPLARLFMSGGGPAVAAKAAALGLGAAAVTGTAVVAPEMLDHRPHRTTSTAAARTGRPAREAAPIAFLQAPSGVHPASLPVRLAIAKRTTEAERRDGGRTTTAADRHDGGGTTTEAERRDGGRTTTEAEGHDGGATTTSSSRDGGGDSGSSDSGSVSSGSGDGEHEQTTPTTTTTTTTTTSPATTTTSPLPVTVPTVDLSGGDGGGADG